MGRYSVELRELVEDCFYDIFNFDYDFYTDDPTIKANFERKFIQKYYFREIGFDTPQKFSWYLKSRLDELAPYYKELYRSQVEAAGYNFLENKNYTEVYESIINNNNLRVDEIDKLLSGTNKNITDDNSTITDNTTNTNKVEGTHSSFEIQNSQKQKHYNNLNNFCCRSHIQSNQCQLNLLRFVLIFCQNHFCSYIFSRPSLYRIS